eukprot:TRINITY_DN1841_c0_g1_i1.p4 TRINITY_DN1841_c0_g1~~TRINITY_DN1841_c0_g1_i1.p4  ORF type:complete len:122 (+),score=16.60 TRINITY_DN1841_c0_g1_i1:1397-1762(+)
MIKQNESDANRDAKIKEFEKKVAVFETKLKKLIKGSMKDVTTANTETNATSVEELAALRGIMRKLRGEVERTVKENNEKKNEAEELLGRLKREYVEVQKVSLEQAGNKHKIESKSEHSEIG